MLGKVVTRQRMTWRKKDVTTTLMLLFLLGASLTLLQVPSEGEEATPSQILERRLSKKELQGKHARPVSPYYSLRNTYFRLAKQADWHRNVRGHFIAAGIVTMLLIYLTYVSLKVYCNRLFYDSGTISDYTEQIVSPVKWIALDGNIFEIMMENSILEISLVCSLRDGEMSSEDGTIEVESSSPVNGRTRLMLRSNSEMTGTRTSTSALRVGDAFKFVDDAGEEVPCSYLGDRIQWRGAALYRCDEEYICVDDHVVVLKGGEWHDGIIESVKENGLDEKSYDVRCFGEHRDALDNILCGVRREGIRHLKIASGDKMRIAWQGASFYFDKILDLTSMYVYIRNRQWKHLTLNLFGLIWCSLESAKVIDKVTDAIVEYDHEELARITLNPAPILDFVGHTYYLELRESWRRKYPTNNFFYLQSTEASVEGLVGMLVQSIAFMSTWNYTFVEQCVLAQSIIKHAFHYAATSTHDNEIIYGQKLENPSKQREFKLRFVAELHVISMTRLLDTVTRCCCIASFGFSFQPFGILLWFLWTVLSTYFLFRCVDKNMSRGDAIWNAVLPENWLSISEPYLMNQQLELTLSRDAGLTRKLVVVSRVMHAFENIVMYALMYMLSPDEVAHHLLHGHRCLIFMFGFLALPACWAFEWLALWIGTSSMFHSMPTKPKLSEPMGDSTYSVLCETEDAEQILKA